MDKNSKFSDDTTKDHQKVVVFFQKMNKIDSTKLVLIK